MRTVIKCHSLPSEISFTGWRHFADGREISLRSRNCDEISPFVSAKYRSKRREISLELSSELLTKVRENKERNLRNSLRLLLHNTVFISVWLLNVELGSTNVRLITRTMMVRITTT